MARYTDPFLNAIMTSHQISVRAELTPINGEPICSLPLVSGSVSADRNALVRRSAQFTVDPTLAPTSTLDRLTPYGAQVRIWRGIRYTNATVEDYPIFTGRVESVDNAIDGVTVRCMDHNADIVDAKFANPSDGVATYNELCYSEARRFIRQVFPTATVRIETPSLAKVTRAMTVERERTELLNLLCTPMGAEWYADFSGVFHIRTLPAVITPTTQPTWIIDSGDRGVTVDRTATLDRVDVYNQVIVEGEAIGGALGAYGEWHVPGPGESGYDPNNPMSFGGPFGKVAGFFSGQAVNTTADANALAKTLCLNSIAKTRSVTVTCIPNPKLGLGDVVRIFGLSAGIDGMYFVQSIDMPLGPDEAMQVILNESLEVGVTGEVVPQHLMSMRIPEGAQWP